MGDLIFALDIGTRSVVGIIAEQTNRGIKVNGVEVIEHQQRSMLDGQIHDIQAVAQVVRLVKERLEKRHQVKLEQAAAAAAGRSLQTVTAKAQQQCNLLEPIVREEVQALELEAVYQAQTQLSQQRGHSEYHLIGYSLIRHWLDNAPIGNPIGQFGELLQAEVIATFLPRVVVDSLFAVLQQAGLAMQSLTLEPIAAITAGIPQGMRGLNLALVDVGAGTSDIAITAGGSVIAYGMVPVAGDEITEALCQQYLLSFAEGERVKRQLRQASEVQFTDIVGNTSCLPVKEIMQSLNQSIEQLALQIAQEILNLNQKTPQAVMLVGGGSLTPTLDVALARCLELVVSRVAVRSREHLEGYYGNLKRLTGPQAVTPLGIVVTALAASDQGFGHATVNGRPVRLLSFKTLKVQDVLVAAGVRGNQILGRPGPALTLEVNGQLQFIKGQMGKPARIWLNGQAANLDDPVNPGDQLELAAASDGEPGQGKIADLLPPPLTIQFNGQTIQHSSRCRLNGAEVDGDQLLFDGARLQITTLERLSHVLDWLGLKPGPGSECYLNGQPVGLDEPVGDGALLEYFAEGKPKPGRHQVVVNGQTLKFPAERTNLIVTDILTAVNFPNKPPTSHSRLLLLVNDQPAGFTTPLVDGDRVTLSWTEAK